MDASACLADGQCFCAQTTPRCERLAAHAIAKSGLIAYLPRRCERVHAGRRERMVERPMFPMYLFVKCLPQPEHWHIVYVAPGVRHMLGVGKPASLDDGCIDAVRLAEAKCAERDDKSVRPGRSSIVWHFTAGDIVRITQGPFAGFYAKLVCAVDHHDRVRALVSLFGGSATADISAFHVAAVTA